MPPQDAEYGGVAPTARKHEPDAHGQAALLLAESILHALVERGVMTTSEAALAVRVAAEVKRDVAAAIGESKRRMEASLALLAAIEASFETDRRG